MEYFNNCKHSLLYKIIYNKRISMINEYCKYVILRSNNQSSVRRLLNIANEYFIYGICHVDNYVRYIDSYIGTKYKCRKFYGIGQCELSSDHEFIRYSCGNIIKFE